MLQVTITIFDIRADRVPKECNLHAYGMWFNNASVASGQGLEQMLSMADCKTLSITVVAGKTYAVHSSELSMRQNARVCIVSTVCVYVV
jgi:hypothetical protein